jgi:hypothetical protein
MLWENEARGQAGPRRLRSRSRYDPHAQQSWAKQQEEMFADMLYKFLLAEAFEMEVDDTRPWLAGLFKWLARQKGKLTSCGELREILLQGLSQAIERGKAECVPCPSRNGSTLPDKNATT